MGLLKKKKQKNQMGNILNFEGIIFIQQKEENFQYRTLNTERGFKSRCETHS